MRFSRQNLPKSRDDLDRFVREHELRPYGVVEYKGRDIFIAETDLVQDNSAECPLGFYQVAWFITKPDSTEDMDIGRGIDFEARHDSDNNWTQEAKRDARIQTAIKDAQRFIDNSIKTGRLQ